MTNQEPIPNSSNEAWEEELFGILYDEYGDVGTNLTVRDFVKKVRHSALDKQREQVLEKTKQIISEHNARILNEFQLQGKPDMPFIAYDETVCLIPAILKATDKTVSLLQDMKKNK